jgi:hypothetical protein
MRRISRPGRQGDKKRQVGDKSHYRINAHFPQGVPE